MLAMHFLLNFVVAYLAMLGSSLLLPPGERGDYALWISIGAALALTTIIVFGTIAGRIEQRRASLAGQKLDAQCAAVAALHEDASVTPLSSGRFLLTDIRTGKTIAEVDAPALGDTFDR